MFLFPFGKKIPKHLFKKKSYQMFYHEKQVKKKRRVSVNDGEERSLRISLSPEAPLWNPKEPNMRTSSKTFSFHALSELFGSPSIWKGVVLRGLPS